MAEEKGLRTMNTDVTKKDESSSKSEKAQDQRAISGADRSVPDARLAMHPSQATKERGAPIGSPLRVEIKASEDPKRKEPTDSQADDLAAIAAGNPNDDPRDFSAEITGNEIRLCVDGKETTLLPDEAHRLTGILEKAKMELQF